MNTSNTPNLGYGSAAAAGWYTCPGDPRLMRYWDGAAWTAHTHPHPAIAPAPHPAGYGWPPYGAGFGHPAVPAPTAQDTTLRRLAEYSRLSGIFWIILGVLQVLGVFTAIAGIWNIVVGVSRLRTAGRITARDPKIPGEFRGVAGLVIIAVINLFLGAAIGVVLVAVDFFVRDQILKNAHLFRGAPASATTAAYGAPLPAAAPPAG